MRLPPPPVLDDRCRALVEQARGESGAAREATLATLDQLLYGALWHWLDTGERTYRPVVDRWAPYRRLVDGAPTDAADPFGLRYDLTHRPGLAPTHAMVCVSMTRYCQLRCTYCKFKWWVDNEIPDDSLLGAVDLLFSSSAEHLHLDFVGGEPLLYADKVLAALDAARAREAATGRYLQATVVTNAMRLTPDLADALAARGARILVSLDGGDGRMAQFRKTKPRFVGEESLHTQVARTLAYLLERGHAHQAVMTVPPEAAATLYDDFAHIVSLGARSVQVQYGIGWAWSDTDQATFLQQLQRVVDDFVLPGRVHLDNLLRREPILLDASPTVEPDGTLILGSDCMLENEHPKDPLYILGHIPGLTELDRIGGSRFQTLYMLSRHYGDQRDSHRVVIRDNVRMGYALERVLEPVRAVLGTGGVQAPQGRPAGSPGSAAAQSAAGNGESGR